MHRVITLLLVAALVSCGLPNPREDVRLGREVAEVGEENRDLERLIEIRPRRPGNGPQVARISGTISGVSVASAP